MRARQEQGAHRGDEESDDDAEEDGQEEPRFWEEISTEAEKEELGASGVW